MKIALIRAGLRVSETFCDERRHRDVHRNRQRHIQPAFAKEATDVSANVPEAAVSNASLAQPCFVMIIDRPPSCAL
jgi:hypothetical protein